MDPVITTGQITPAFQLHDLHGNSYALKEMLGGILLLNFWSAECSWCERVDREINASREHWKDTVTVWWIASNEGEPVDQIVRVAAERKLPVVLLDSHQQVADLYGALTTPHFFVVDQAGKLAYQGAWDDITFRQRVATQAYVLKVIDALNIGRVPEITQTPPYGCVLVRAYPDSR